MIGALLRKDLRVLRRSPAMLALIVIYPLLIALGLGLALTREPEPPKIAVVNLLPRDGEKGAVVIAGQKLSIADLEGSLAGGQVESINVATREEAVRMIEAGTIDGALVIPADAASKLESTLETGGVTSGPELEVLYRSSGPLDGTLVRSIIASRLRLAERALANEIVRIATGFLEILRTGGEFEVFGAKVRVLGLQAAELLVRESAKELPADRRGGLEEAEKFAQLARQNLDLSDDILRSIARPLEIKETGIGEAEGRTLSGFAVGVAAALSLMLVAMTLAAGLLASEREEGTLRRLLRGGRGAWQVAGAKVLGATIVAAGSGLLLLAGVATLGATPWSSAPWWIPALLLGALGCAALGVLLGAALRDARAAMLAAILLAVPVAVMALIPQQTVGGTGADVLAFVSAALPFAAARDLLDAAIAAQPDWGAAGRLVGQATVFTVAAGLLVQRSRA